MEIMIRKAVYDDIKGMASMLSELFSIESDFKVDLEIQKKGLILLLNSKYSVVFAAESDGKLCGMVTGQLVVSTASGGYSVLLEDLFVKKEFRKSGIASKLVTAVENWAIYNNAKRIQLVADETNTTALNFYKNRNFIPGRMRGLYKQINLM